MPVSAAPNHGANNPLSRTIKPGIPSKAERLLALGDNDRPNLKRYSTEQNRLGALLEAHEELKQNLAKPVNTELLDIHDWTVDDLFPDPDAIFHDPKHVQSELSRRGSTGFTAKQAESHDLYYDSAQVPMHVSQQTSASAMRDLGLHKRGPAPRITVDDSALPKSHKLTLKKKPNAPEKRKRFQRNGSADEDSKKNGFAQFFGYHKTQSPATFISPPMPPIPSRSVSSFTHGSESPFSHPDASAQAFNDPVDNVTAEYTPMAPMNPSRPLARPDDDVLQGAKKNIRRPPKGIRNWFDGFEVSSDDEVYEPVPAEVVAAELPPQELPGSEVVITQPPRTRESVTSAPYSGRQINGTQLRSREASSETSGVQVRRKSSRKRASYGKSSRGHRSASRGPSDRAETYRSSVGVESETNRRPVRSTPSRLASESVLSLSSSEGREYIGSDPGSTYDRDSTVLLGQAAPVDMHKVRPRQLLSQPSYQRDPVVGRQKSVSTGQASSPPAPMRYSDDRSRQTESSAPRRTSDDAGPPSRKDKSLASSRYSSPSRHTYATSAGRSGDRPRMMEVTEEEMILLELMRNKRANRAAMQKQSFTEGYQAALEKSRQSQTHLPESRSDSKLPIDVSGNGEAHVDAPAEDLAPGSRRFSFLQKEDVDRSLNIERFLAQESPAPPALYDDLAEASSIHEDEEPASASRDTNHEDFDHTHQSARQRPRAAPRESQLDRLRYKFASSSAPELVQPAGPGTGRKHRGETGRPQIVIPSARRAPVEERPTIPQRHPRRTSPTGGHAPFDIGPEMDFQEPQVPPTPIEDARQSYCPSLPASAPLSLPVPSAAVPRYTREEADDERSSSSGSAPRESPRMAFANAFSKLQRPSAPASTGRSFTSPPGPTRPFQDFKQTIPSSGDRTSAGNVLQNHSRQQPDQRPDRNEAMTPETEISQSFSVTSSPFQATGNTAIVSNGVTSGTVSPISFRRPSIPQHVHRSHPATVQQAGNGPNGSAAYSQDSHRPMSSTQSGGAGAMGNRKKERASMMSMTSVGEDVLAAWAELGGGTLAIRGYNS